jgi:hypothetical protein
MPVQICLGTFLAKLFGYSFTLLRFSTIMLLFVAVVSLYCLLRDFDAGDAEAALGRWKAAEIAGSDASDPNDVAGNMSWSCYHGACDEWVAQTGGPQNVPVYHGAERLHPGFFDYLAQQYDARTTLLVRLSRNRGGRF